MSRNTPRHIVVILLSGALSAVSHEVNPSDFTVPPPSRDRPVDLEHMPLFIVNGGWYSGFRIVGPSMSFAEMLARSSKRRRQMQTHPHKRAKWRTR